MKKNFIALFIMALTNIAYAQTNKIAVEVSFNGTRCNGSHGLCVVEPTLSKSVYNAHMYLNEKGLLVMEIIISNLEEGQLNNILGETYLSSKTVYTFTMEDTFVLSDELRFALKLPNGKGEIPKGSYTAVVGNELITLVFGLR
jgi:hypothetical protein